MNICRGLFSKELAIKDFIDREEIELFSLSETDLEFFDTQKPFGIKGFRTFYPLQRKEDNDIKRMLVFVKEDIEVTQRTDLMSKSISTVWLEIRGKNEKKILLCTLYREFNSITGEENDQSMPEQIKRFEELCTQIEKAANEASTICLGDMNINTNMWNEYDFYLKKLADKYQACLGSNGL